MDNKEIVNRLSSSLGRSKKDVTSLLGALANVVMERLAEQDDVLVPQFGTFQARLRLESVEVDAASGKRTLVPPCVDAQFVASNVFTKRLNLENSKA